MCSAHLSKDSFRELSFPGIVWEEYAAEYLQVANTGSIGLNFGSDEAVLLHVLGPVFLVFGCLGNGQGQLPHCMEWSISE